ncbi:MAG: S41 family peptidase [Chloroflexi bacterium]|nr:S41 family peptidase [Chloroflexota bacterium]
MSTAAPPISIIVPQDAPAEMRALWEIYSILLNEHADRAKLDPKELSEGAIQGLLKTLNDPHTSYIPPEDYQLEQEDIRGTFEGIGAEVTMRGGRLIISPLPEGPAEQAGLKAGDAILEVNSEPTEGWSIRQAVLKIRGPKGSKVHLKVLHLGAAEPVEVDIVRDTIPLKSVFWNMMKDNIAYLRIRIFYGNTDDAVRQALREIRAKGASGIVLDLRDNPGGLLETTVNVTSEFIREGVVLSEVDGKGQQKEWRVRGGGLAVNLPLVVLVNSFSASGSEVLAGALQDYGRARLVGVKTFGKGSVNLFRRLSNGGGLYYSTAYWYTPNGRLIHQTGLEPDVEVKAIPGEQGDTQLVRAVEVLKKEMGITAVVP